MERVIPQASNTERELFIESLKLMLGAYAILNTQYNTIRPIVSSRDSVIGTKKHNSEDMIVCIVPKSITFIDTINTLLKKFIENHLKYNITGPSHKKSLGHKANNKPYVVELKFSIVIRLVCIQWFYNNFTIYYAIGDNLTHNDRKIDNFRRRALHLEVVPLERALKIDKQYSSNIIQDFQIVYL